jgi:hypothetical protein
MGMLSVMIPRPIRSITAALLVALLGILHGGMPSHSHEADRPDAVPGVVAISAAAHAHGVILLDTAERIPATSAEFPVPAVRPDTASAALTERSVDGYDAAPLRPSERGPPPAAPRAPPRFI